MTDIDKPPSLTKRQAYRDLKPGDPFTLIEPQVVYVEDDAGKTLRPVAVGDLISKWFATDEPGRMFKVIRIHEPSTYETVFEGFQQLEVKGDA